MRIDRELVRRVEHSAAEFSSRQALAYTVHAAPAGAAAEPCDGGALISFGPGRYVNRAIGLGLGGTDAGEVVSALDRFYSGRGLAASLELSPWADETLLPALIADGYVLERFRNLYAHDLSNLGSDPDVEIVTDDDTTATQRQAILSGDAALGSTARQISDEYCITAAAVDGAHDFVALVDGTPAACGSLNLVDGVGWLGGAATTEAHRRAGLQTALLHHRLRLASDLGCAIAAATALPAGQSARNLERLGFQLLYTQVVLTRSGRPESTIGAGTS